MSTVLDQHLEMLDEMEASLRDALRTVRDSLYTILGMDDAVEGTQPPGSISHVAGLCIEKVDKVLGER